MARVPVIVNTQHGLRVGKSWRHKLQFQIANRLTQQIVAVSDDAAKLCRQVDPVSTNKITRIWNGIDLTRFQYHGPKLGGDTINAISVARLSPEKDFPTMLRAVARVVQQVPQFRLTIVGDGADRQMLEN